MTPEQFEVIGKSCRTRQELEQLKANAISRGRKDFGEVADRLLNERFPIHTRKGGGATPSNVTFNGKCHRFLSGKEGYVWLVNQFGVYKQTIFAEYEEIYRKRERSGCRLAQSRERLFPVGSDRADNASHSSPVVGGWYLDTNLNHLEKFELLIHLGYLANLQFAKDWDFEIEGSTEQLVQRQQRIIRAEEILQKFLAV